jgi:hypothetical protein
MENLINTNPIMTGIFLFIGGTILEAKLPKKGIFVVFNWVTLIGSISLIIWGVVKTF